MLGVGGAGGAEEHIAAGVRHVLRLDADLSTFYEAAAEEVDSDALVERILARVVVP